MIALALISTRYAPTDVSSKPLPEKPKFITSTPSSRLTMLVVAAPGREARAAPRYRGAIHGDVSAQAARRGMNGASPARSARVPAR